MRAIIVAGYHAGRVVTVDDDVSGLRMAIMPEPLTCIKPQQMEFAAERENPYYLSYVELTRKGDTAYYAPPSIDTFDLITHLINK